MQTNTLYLHNFEEYVTSTNERHNVLDHRNMNGAVAISATDAAILMAETKQDIVGEFTSILTDFRGGMGRTGE